jgi:hypothetical protein
MNLKLLRSTLCLLWLSALFVDGAIAQLGGAGDIRAKFANDYNAGKFRDVIADAAALQKLNAMDAETARVTAQAYYKAGDYAGCVKYIRKNENFNPSVNPQLADVGTILLKRCQKS